MGFRAHGQLTGPMRLAQPLLQRVLKRQFAGQCATLKRLLEGAPGRPSSPTAGRAARRRARSGGRRRRGSTASVPTRMSRLRARVTAV